MTPRARLVTAVVACALALCLPAAVGGADDPEWLAHLKTWSRAVEGHVPGQASDAVQELAAWSADDVQAVVHDFLALHAALKKQAQAQPGGKAEAERRRIRPWVDYKDLRLWSEDLQKEAVFRDLSTDGSNRAIRQAAMLHADVALLAPLDRTTITGTPDTIKVLDGIVVGYENQSTHWGAGRKLLDAILPAPDADPFVRTWYHAVAAHFLEQSNLSAARPHLERALEVLPRDADIHYESGFYHQVSATPAIDAVRRAQRAIRTRQRFQDGESTESHRKDAERRFRQAVTLDPGHAEARVRLGAALLDLDRVEDAARELKQAVPAAGHPLLSYYAHLLLGQAEERLGRLDAAVASYEQAKALFPDARSPQFALAALDRRRGARERAWQTVAPLIAPSAPDQQAVDPWCSFSQWQLKPAQALLADVRARAAGEGR